MVFLFWKDWDQELIELQASAAANTGTILCKYCIIPLQKGICLVSLFLVSPYFEYQAWVLMKAY
jgi:hypothetical protein